MHYKYLKANMKRFKRYIQIFFLLTGLISLQSCADDILYLSPEILEEGETTADMSFSFSPFAAGELTRATLTPPGRGFNELTDLVVLLYDKNGNLLENEFGIRNIPFEQNDLVSADRSDADASNNQSAETDTKQLNTSLRLPVGEYYIIGVANMGQTNSSDQTVTTTYHVLTTEYADDIKTLDGLRRIKVKWVGDNYRNNREMLGFFCDTQSKPEPPTAESIFRTVKINRPNMKLQCWLRRCASKITVDFDASELRDNINIYVQDVRIYDVPSSCTLGFGKPSSTDENLIDYNNHPKAVEDIIKRKDYNDLSVHNIDYGEGSDYTKWPRLNNLNPYIMEGGERKNFHAQDAPALYFYENLQGDGDDRTPVPDLETGGVAGGYKEKDKKPFGTYIEVRAYYTSEVEGNSDKYEIKYRFMLGRNVTTNYDAERNYHYKLTLKFRGNANDYNWQIDYDRTEGFRVPNPWYVSYLYNQDAYLPFEFYVDPEWEVADMKAEIVTNPWYPTNGEEDDESTLTNPNLEITPIVPAGDTNAAYAYTGNPINRMNWNGFLSLKVPSSESVLTDHDVGIPWKGYDDQKAEVINQKYYVDNKIGERDIIINGNVVATNNDREKVYLKDEKNGNYSINIPLFTREKALVKQTGYTGNNPFVGYQRVAKIKLSTTVRKKENHSITRQIKDAYVNVVQVRRVVNPKGVYRRANNFEPFHVNLKFLSSEARDATFRSIKSRGPWMAEILGDANFITLDGKQEVSGVSGSEIDFVIRFNRMGGTGNKNAIVRIKYHNYTCTHLIFVRRGYDAQAIVPSGRDFYHNTENGGATPTKWETFNMIAQNKMASDPRDEGSMFKFGNSGIAIDAINNAYKDSSGKEMYHDLSEDEFVPHPYLTTLNANGNPNANNTTWASIVKDEKGFTSGKMAQAATMRDFEQLYLTKYVEFGYGILYADGASTTQSTLEMVNGWHRDDPSSSKNEKGMRGVFAYYWNPDGSTCNTKNIFFPIGRSGYGHRKNSNEQVNDNPGQNGKGILRYSANRCARAMEYGGVYENFQKVAPLFESIYRRPGAIYWARHREINALEWNAKPLNNKTTYEAFGLDLNYFTLDVNLISGVNVDYGNDACFVRTVASGN